MNKLQLEGMLPGEILADQFEIERLAGSGGMGQVYRAIDLRTGATVALKIQQPGLSPEYVERFESEAHMLAYIEHPHIVRYITHGALPNGNRYLIMEWLEGESLAARLCRRELSVDESITLGTGVAEALGALHARGIIHRDLKPGNLFLPGGSIDEVKLLDFGIARLTYLPRVTRAGRILGTPGYMAPEQARGSDVISTQADVFALGSILFECLTGSQPFPGRGAMAVLAKIVLARVPSVRKLAPGVPPPLDALLTRMLAKDPAARPVNGADVAAELVTLQRGEDVERGAEGPRRTSLTRGEQQLLSVVLLAGEPPADAFVMSTLAARVMASPKGDLRRIAAQYGARIEVLADGSAAATLVGPSVATDQATLGARCALALRALWPDRPMALSMGRGEIDGQLPVGEVIERAAEMLRAPVGQPAQGPLPIIIDALSAGLLDERFEVEERDGKLALLGVHEAALGVRTLLGETTTYVGRQRELATLEVLFTECRTESTARLVLVTAPAGAGKSRLRHEFLERVKGEDVEIWFARGDPMRASAPFELLRQVVRQAARLQAGESALVAREKLMARVSHVDSATRARVAEFLGEVVGTPFPDENSVQLRAARTNARLMGDQMRRALVDFIKAECLARPLLLVLEDLHWGDLPTIECVDMALRILRDRPLLVLALARPEIHKLFPSLWSAHPVQELRLRELSRRACEALARQVLEASVPVEVSSRIAERSQGNAFFLEEFVRAAAEGRQEETPATVIAMVQARLRSLAPEERRLLRAGSVFGQVFWRGAAAALLDSGRRSSALSPMLAKLEEGEWIIPQREAKFQGEQEYTFQHALVREAAYATLTAEDQAIGHRLAGEWLVAVGEIDAQVVAAHFERGDEPGRAVSFYHLAAEQALRANDLRAAIERVEHALACGASGEVRGELLRIRADAYDWLGEFADAEQWALEAMGLLPTGSPRWYAAVGAAAWAVGALGHTPRLLELASKVEDAWSEEGASGLQMRAATWTAMWILISGAYDAARRLFARVEALADRFGDEPEVGAVIASGRASFMMFNEGIDTSRELYEVVIECLEQAGDQRSACNERVNLSRIQSQLGAYAEASSSLRSALVDAERMGLRTVAAMAKHTLSCALIGLGALDEARPILVHALSSFSEQGSQRMVGYCRAYLASILRRTGELAEAEAEAHRAVEELSSIKPSQPLALATLAEVLLARGSSSAALAAARQAAELLDSLGQIEEGEALVRLVYAEALAEEGELDAARAAIVAARDRLLDRAARISSSTYRESFLERVPENARTLLRAREWARPE